MAELRNGTTALLQVPELQKHAYDLRAILFHDGLIGREHSYAYLRDPSSGNWFKSCDASITHVTEETILSDAGGLHLNAGPYFFLYSEAEQESQESVPASWPDDITEAVKLHNALFQTEISRSDDNPVTNNSKEPTVDGRDHQSSSTESGRASRGSSRPLSESMTSPAASDVAENHTLATTPS